MAVQSPQLDNQYLGGADIWDNGLVGDILLADYFDVVTSNDRYWVGGTGDWSDTAHWSTASGGAGGASAPTYSSNVFIDNSSGFGSGGTITVDNNAECLDFVSSTSHSYTIDDSGNEFYIGISGSYASGSGITFGGAVYILLLSETAETIDSGGSALPMVIFGASGGYTLLSNIDAFEIKINPLGFVSLDTGGYDVSTTNTEVLGGDGYGADLVLNDSIWETNIWGVGTVGGFESSVTIDAGTSTIKLVDFDGEGPLFYGEDRTYYNLLVSSSLPAKIYYNNTFNSILNDSSPQTILFQQSSTQTVNSFNVSGTSGDNVVIGSTPDYFSDGASYDYSAELLTNPDFTGNATGWNLDSGWTYGSNAVASSETLGSNLLTNSTFTGGTSGWTLTGTGFSYGSNNVTYTGSGLSSSIYQAPSINHNDFYKISVSVSGQSGDPVNCLVDGNQVLIDMMTTGTNSGYWQYSSLVSDGTDRVSFTGTTGDVTLDNVELRQITSGQLSQNVTLVAGKTYKLSISLSGSTGSIGLYEASSSDFYTDTHNVGQVVAGATEDIFFVSNGAGAIYVQAYPSPYGNFDGSVLSLSLQEATPKPHNLSKTSGVVTADYVEIYSSQASGGATWNATNAVDGGGNTGWNFIYSNTYTISHTTSANKRRADNIITHTTNSLKRNTTTLSHTTSSNKRKTTTLTHTTNSLNRKSTAISHTTSANKRKANLTLSHTTSASITKPQYTRTHTADALKTVGTTEVTNIYYVSASADDAWENLGGTVSITATGNGDGPTFDRDNHIGLRFPNVTIPQGTTITAAYLRFPQLFNYSGFSNILGQVHAQNVDNASQFTTTSNDVSGRARTTAFINNPGADANPWTTGNTNRGLAVTTLVQEVVNRGGWSSGNAMAMLLIGDETGATTDFIQPYLWDYTTGFYRAELRIVTTTVSARAMSRDHTTDASKVVAAPSYTRTHTTSSNKRKATTVSHTTGTLLRKQSVASHTTSSNKRKAVTVSHTTGSLLRKQAVVSHTTSSNKRQTGLTVSHTTSSNKKTTTSVSHTTGILKRALRTASHTTDSLKRISATRSHTTNSLLRKTNTVSHTTSANKRQAILVSHTTNSNKKKANNTLTHTTNSLKRVISVLSHTTNTVLRRSIVLSHTTNTLLRKQDTRSHTTNSNKRKQTLASHTTSANKRLASTVAHTTSANKRKTGLAVSHTTNSLLRRQASLVHTTSANKRATSTVSHTTSSYFRGAPSKNHTTDANKKKQTTKFHTTDANKKKSATRSHTTDIYLRKSNLVTHTTSSNKRLTKTVSHTTSINKRRSGLTVSHTTNSFLRLRLTVSHTTSALKRVAITVGHTTSSVKRKANTIQHTTSAVIRRALVVLHTTNTLLRGRITVQHSTDALLRKQNTVSTVTDANKRRDDNTISHSTNAVILGAHYAIHSTSTSLWSRAGNKAVLVNGEWVYGVVMVLDGSEWVPTTVMYYNGSTWVKTVE